MKRLLVLGLLGTLAACPPVSSTSEGPEIRLRVQPSDSISFTNETLNPDMTRDVDTMNYEFTLEVETSFGETLTGTKYTYAVVNELEGSVTPPGMALTAADFMYDTSFDALRSRTFTSKTMFVIPGTMMGQMVMFEMQAIDDEGLRSNVVSFSALLD